MIRKEATAELSARLEHYINPRNDPRIYWAKGVTLDYATPRQTRVDYMLFKPVNNSTSGIEKGDFSAYEVKSSVEDFNSPNGHNHPGDFNYYVMYEDVYETVRAKIPYFVGVLVPDNSGGLRHVKKAHRVERQKPVSEMLLIMFRSSNRELIKYRKADKLGYKVMSADIAVKGIETVPAADVVPVVRCKDCKHMSPMSNCIRYCEAWGGVNGMGDDGFCNYGERRNT